MGLCDKLEEKLRKEREESQKLVEAVVKGLLESEVLGKSDLDKHTDAGSCDSIEINFLFCRIRD